MGELVPRIMGELVVRLAAVTDSRRNQVARRERGLARVGVVTWWAAVGAAAGTVLAGVGLAQVSASASPPLSGPVADAAVTPPAGLWPATDESGDSNPDQGAGRGTFSGLQPPVSAPGWSHRGGHTSSGAS